MYEFIFNPFNGLNNVKYILFGKILIFSTHRSKEKIDNKIKTFLSMVLKTSILIVVS